MKIKGWRIRDISKSDRETLLDIFKKLGGMERCADPVDVHTNPVLLGFP
jgi:hypothetical protein